MKRLLLCALALSALLNFRAYGKDEKAAVEDFKKDMATMKAWKEEKQKALAQNPAGKGAALVEMQAKMKTVATDGLPADLKEAWGAMLETFDKMVEITSAFPSDPAELKTRSSEPDFQAKVAEMQKKMMEIQTIGDARSKKFKELCAKYGIDAVK